MRTWPLVVACVVVTCAPQERQPTSIVVLVPEAGLTSSLGAGEWVWPARYSRITFRNGTANAERLSVSFPCDLSEVSQLTLRPLEEKSFEFTCAYTEWSASLADGSLPLHVVVQPGDAGAAEEPDCLISADVTRWPAVPMFAADAGAIDLSLSVRNDSWMARQPLRLCPVSIEGCASSHITWSTNSIDDIRLGRTVDGAFLADQADLDEHCDLTVRGPRNSAQLSLHLQTEPLCPSADRHCPMVRDSSIVFGLASSASLVALGADGGRELGGFSTVQSLSEGAIGIGDVAVDVAGALWATVGGQICAAGLESRFVRGCQLPRVEQAVGIAGATDGGLWFANTGLHRFNPLTGDEQTMVAAGSFHLEGDVQTLGQSVFVITSGVAAPELWRYDELDAGFSRVAALSLSSPAGIALDGTDLLVLTANGYRVRINPQTGAIISSEVTPWSWRGAAVKPRP